MSRINALWMTVGVFTALFLLFPLCFVAGHLAIPAQFLHGFFPWKAAPLTLPAGNTLRPDIFDSMLQNWSQVSVTFSHLWSPYIHGGMPTSSLIITGHASPLVAPFLLITSPIMALHFSMLARVAVAFIGIYLYLRKVGCVPVIAFIGGLSFSIGGFNSVWLAWPQGTVTAFAPWILLSIEVTRKERLTGAFLLAGSTYGLLTGGFPTVGAHYLYFAGTYILFLVLIPLGFAKQYSTFFLSAVTYGGGVVIGIGLTAVYLLPTMEYIDFVNVSYRNPFGHLPQATIPQLVVPFFYGNHTFAPWLGHLNYNETTGYIGILIIASVLISPVAILVSNRRYKILFLLTSAAVAFFAIYGIGLAIEVVGRLPVLDSGNNWRLLSVFGFCLIITGSLVLQVLFVEQWGSFISSSWRRRSLVFGAVVLLAAFNISFVYLITSYGWDDLRTIIDNLLEDASVIIHNIYWLRMASVVFATGLLSVAAWSLWSSTYTNRRWIMAVGATAVTIVDMGVFNFRQNSTVPEEAVFPVTPGIVYLQETTDQPYERVLALDNTFFHPGTHVIYGIPSTVSHAFATPTRRAFIEAYLGDFRTPTAILPTLNSTNLTSPLLNLTGAKYITLRPNSDITTMNIEQPLNTLPVQLPPSGIPIWQTFKAISENLSEACVKVATYKKQIPVNEGSLTITLAQAENLLDISEYDLSTFVDNAWFCTEFSLDQLIEGEEYSLIFEHNGTEDFQVALWGHDENLYKLGEASGEGVSADPDLTFNIIYNSRNRELDEQFAQVYSGEDLIVYQNRKAIFAYVTNQIQVTYSDDELINYLETETGIAVVDHAIDIENGDKCYIELEPETFSNDKVTYILNHDCSGILATSEAYYPGWKVEVDDEVREVLRVNGIMRGVQVKEGDTQVTFTYHPQSFTTGAVISLISALATLGILAAAVFNRHTA